ncbi:DUF6596 domain-containing protein [Sphingomicrobium sp. XHP0235]|uniref:RNA polymerase sigma factor n=1 Tax=Sphingomicrobium aquimarinum TaxID=3133971 RepID=UPI0031FEE908
MAGRGLGADAMAVRPRVVAALAAQFRDLEAADEGFDAAVEKLVASGSRPDDVAAFLFVAAKRSIIDTRRKSVREQRAIEGAVTLAEPAVIAFPEAVPDERLRLLFICCHPAIGLEARAMLALRIVLGVEVGAIASGFLLNVDAVRQRITRAKAKVGAAGIPFELPHRRNWGERVEAILLALEQAYVAAYREGARDELTAEVERLAEMLVDLLPDEPEARALAALVLLARSRQAARGGGNIPLSEQDSALWDRERIERARALLDAPFDGRPGRFRILALIHLTHARRAFGASTDWPAIVKLYDALATLDGGPTVAIARAVAMAQAGDAGAALEALPEESHDYAPWHAARGDILARLGRGDEARAALERALSLTQGDGPRALLRARLERLS